MKTQIIELIAREFGLNKEKIKLTDKLKDDLGLDSLDLVDLSIIIEEEFNFCEAPNSELEKVSTVGDIVEYVIKMKGKEK